MKKLSENLNFSVILAKYLRLFLLNKSKIIVCFSLIFVLNEKVRLKYSVK